MGLFNEILTFRRIFFPFKRNLGSAGNNSVIDTPVFFVRTKHVHM